MKKRPIQIWGTGSDVGKSIIVSGLCRIFKQDGLFVAPFKAQNMALNSYVTFEGAEIGRAQAEQAYACGIAPIADMNPILIKPNTDTKAQIILHGRPAGNMNAAEYVKQKPRFFKYVTESYGRLKKKYDLIVIEGAGSPAEINLKKHDIVNLKMAKHADANVILVGDIDKGGVFASLIGTLELLTDNERKRIKGFIINKFRGDKRLLKGGVRFLEKKTGKKVFGVLPYLKNLKISEEDSVCLDNIKQKQGRKKPALINIAVIHLPRMSNFTDFDVFNNDSDINLRYATDTAELENVDIIILPGTKSTIADLGWLRKSGLADKILSTINYRSSTFLIGICGGFQMMGKEIRDPYYIESKKEKIFGLGLFDFKTVIAKNKQTYQVEAEDIETGISVVGYEIHHGKTLMPPNIEGAFRIRRRKGKRVNIIDGATDNKRRIWGTYIHGIFDSVSFRGQFLNYALKLKKHKTKINAFAFQDKDAEFNRLAKVMRKNMNITEIYKLLNGKKRR